MYIYNNLCSKFIQIAIITASIWYKLLAAQTVVEIRPFRLAETTRNCGRQSTWGCPSRQPVFVKDISTLYYYLKALSVYKWSDCQGWIFLLQWWGSTCWIIIVFKMLWDQAGLSYNLRAIWNFGFFANKGGGRSPPVVLRGGSRIWTYILCINEPFVSVNVLKIFFQIYTDIRFK